jgi:hypothetical protein
MNLPSDDTGELSRFVDVDRRACESGAIACDDHVDGMSNGSGNQDVVLKIRAAPFDSVAKDVTGHRQYLERLETNPNSVTLGTCVLGSVPSHEVGESVDAARKRAALDPTSAICFPDRHRVGKPCLPLQKEVGEHVNVEKNLYSPP